MTAAPSPPVASLIQDPRSRGGIGTVVGWYRRWMALHRPGEWFEVYIDEVERGGVLRRGTRVVPAAAGDGATRIPHVLPRLHFPQYVAGRVLAKPVVKDAAEAHAVGAVALQGDLAGPATPLLTWVATTIGSERRAVAATAQVGWPRRAAYRATLPFLERIERSVLRRARRVMVHSPYTADMAIRAGAPAARVEVVPIPIDTEEFTPDAGARRGVLFVGRASDRRKGCDRVMGLLDASAVARDRGVDIVSGGGRPPWATRPDVRWRGTVEDLPAVYREAEIMVLPSRQEGFGIVAFEALASGTPVVAYRCGGPDQSLRDSGGAVVVETDEDFRDAVEGLLADGDRREELGAAGRAWVDANLSAKQFLANPDIFRV